MSVYKIIHSQTTIDLDDIVKNMRSNQKIALIKELRRVSELGLKDSKDIVEKYYSTNGYDEQGLLDQFKIYLEIAEPMTKEEFMNVIEESIDNMETFHFTDMLEAVQTLCENINKKGGLQKLAEERDTFIRGLG